MTEHPVLFVGGGPVDDTIICIEFLTLPHEHHFPNCSTRSGIYTRSGKPEVASVWDEVYDVREVEVLDNVYLVGFYRNGTQALRNLKNEILFRQLKPYRKVGA